MQERVLSPEHPQTLRTTAKLAGSLSDQDKHPEAEALWRQVLEAEERVLGPESPCLPISDHTPTTKGYLGCLPIFRWRQSIKTVPSIKNAGARCQARRRNNITSNH